MFSTRWVYPVVCLAGVMLGETAWAQCNNNGTCNSNENHVSCPNDCFRVGGVVFDNPNDPLFSGLGGVTVVAEGVDGTTGVFNTTTSTGSGQPVVAGIYEFQLSPGRYSLTFTLSGWCFFDAVTQGNNIVPGNPTPLVIDVNSNAGDLGNTNVLAEQSADPCGDDGGCGSNAECNDNNPCTVDTCVDGECQNAAASCCQDGECDDGDPCTDDSCVDGECQNTIGDACCQNDNECDDGDACTDDFCAGGVCQSVDVANCCENDGACNDNNPCTTDTCDDGVCANDPFNDGTACDDNNPCTAEDVCTGGTCAGVLDGSCNPGGGGGGGGGGSPGGSISPALGDLDLDGTPTAEDNCPRTPNGPELGTCVVSGDICTADEGCGAEDRCSLEQDDLDDDGIGDVCDLDRDGDGELNTTDDCPDDEEKRAAGDCGCGTPDIDSDDDGVADCTDGCPEDALKSAPGGCGCGIADDDTDGDAVLDCNDGCPEDEFKTDAGVCGCGAPDDDGDGDGLLDCEDNCPATPNSGTLGTCVTGIIGESCAADADCDCVVDADRGITGTAFGLCSLSQEDGDDNGIGDACQADAQVTCPEPELQEDPIDSTRPCGLNCGNTGGMSMMVMMVGLMLMRVRTRRVDRIGR